MRKSAQLLVIQPPLALLVLSLPQSRPLDERGALLPFRRGFPRPSLRRVERRLCRRGTDVSRREASRRDRRSLCEDLIQSKTACRPYVVRKSQNQNHASAGRLAERALSESLSERCPSRSRIALRWSFGRRTDACYGVRSLSLGVLPGARSSTLHPRDRTLSEPLATMPPTPFGCIRLSGSVPFRHSGGFLESTAHPVIPGR